MLAATVLFAALVWVRASGVRGSDQYGYVADVASLIRGTGNQTNLVFPVVLDHGDPLPRPFMHNVIVTYLPVLPGLLVGAYHGWIVTNILASLLTAYLVYRTVRRFTPHIHALLAASGYLGLPLTVWQATQPLAEATTAPLVALATYLYVTAGTSYTRWLVLTGTAVLLFYARHTFVVLLVVVPLAYLVEQGVTKAKTLVRALGLLVVALSLGAVQHVLFPPYHDFPYAEAFNGTVMEAHNMGHYFSPASGDVGLSTLLGKLERALRIQFAGNAAGLLFFWPFNLLVLVLLVLRLRWYRHRYRRVVAAALVFTVLHGVVIVLYQNQFRYALLATPPLMVALGIVLHERRTLQTANRLRAAVAALLLIGLPVDALLVQQSYRDGVRQRAVREALADVFQEHVPTSASVMVAYEGRHQLMQGFVLRPRTVLYVDPASSGERLEELRRKSATQWLVARLDSPLLEHLNTTPVHDLTGFPEPFDTSGGSASRGEGARCGTRPAGATDKADKPPVLLRTPGRPPARLR